MGEQGKVLTAVSDAVGVIELSHPKANSLTASMLKELAAAVDQLSADDGARVILIRSAGAGAFCAGASFAEFQTISGAESGEEFFMGFARVILAIRRSLKFVVSRVQGKVVGGGLGIVAASDYALALPSASARLSEFELGIGPFTIGPAVERKIGAAAFSQMSIDCEWRQAEWLAARGLYSHLAVDEAELDRKVAETAGKLAAASPAATLALRSVLWEGTEGWEPLLASRARTSGWLLAAGKNETS